ncbi:MAG: PEP-CTERM sorting domain-containing protein [Luteolibacter sp.]
MNTSISPIPDRRHCTRSSSVRSILALAGGAASVPFAVSSVDAAIIVDTSRRGTVIGWNNTPTVTTNSLPGGGGFTLNTRATAGGGGSNSGYIGVVAAWNGTGSGVFRRGGLGLNGAYLAPVDATVAKGTGAGPFANVNLGLSGINSGNAAFSGSSKYLLFSFDNSGTTNYGWIELTATTTGVSGGVSGYSATLGDWAYDDSGATILAGQTGQITAIPEPGPAALTMALVIGAAGLRRWRRQPAARVAPTGEQA